MSFSLTAAVQIHKPTLDFVYLGEATSADRQRNAGITRRLQRAWSFCRRCRMKIYDRSGARLRLKVWMLKAETIEMLLLYDDATWGPNTTDYSRLWQARHSMVLRCSNGGNGSGKTTPYPTQMRLSIQTPRAFRRRCADGGCCSCSYSWVSRNVRERSAWRGRKC